MLLKGLTTSLYSPTQTNTNILQCHYFHIDCVFLLLANKISDNKMPVKSIAKNDSRKNICVKEVQINKYYGTIASRGGVQCMINTMSKLPGAPWWYHTNSAINTKLYKKIKDH